MERRVDPQTVMQAGPLALIVVGGPPGAGKSTLARRVSIELRVPRLGSDMMGRTIQASQALVGHDINAGWIAYDVLFRLADEFLGSGVSTILDLNMGWAFQWEQLDALWQKHPKARVLPIILTCPKAVCLERIAQRHAADPAHYDSPELFVRHPQIVAIWEYLERLDRPDARLIDASGTREDVYTEARRHLEAAAADNLA